MPTDTNDTLAAIDLGEILPDADFPIKDIQNFNPDVFLASPATIAAAVAEYGINGEDGVESLESKIKSRASNADGGKFNKTDVLYQATAPPPAVWDYRCRKCRFYQPERGRGGGGLCEVVGHEEDPLGGVSISPEAWCAVWLPEEGTRMFTYLKNGLEGENR